MRRLAMVFVVISVVGCGTFNSPTKDHTETSTIPGNMVQPVSMTQGSDKAEAQFQGKPASFWAKQLQAKEVASRIEAAKALLAIGPGAKSAVADLKLALNKRAYEVLFTLGGRTTTTTFQSVGKVIIIAPPPKELTKDETIAKLREELADKNATIDLFHKFLNHIYDDPCLQALRAALMAIDRRELEAMNPTTFGK